MPVFTAAIALLVSLAGLVFALLVYAENRRLQRETHRSAALSATHTATLLVDEALDLLRRADALLDAADVEPSGEDARGYEAYRRTVAEDRAALAKAMAELAYGTPALVESRAIAARSTFIIQRTIGGRKVLLRLLTSLRAALLAPRGGDTAAPPTLTLPDSRPEPTHQHAEPAPEAPRLAPAGGRPEPSGAEPSLDPPPADGQAEPAPPVLAEDHPDPTPSAPDGPPPRRRRGGRARRRRSRRGR